ncbi:MAG: Hsp20/alpha crystallin family protein [Desulfatibacillaceae bacterium]|nr:Hsp20/alpha crystallin family protein [Desulfatibacillaceae bacterium]
MDYIKIRFGPGLGRQGASAVNRALETVFGNAGPVYQESRAWRPQMDIYQDKDNIFVIAELAGINPDELEVEIDAAAIRIAGRRAEPPRFEGTRFHLAEIPYGFFERIVYLPSPIDPEKVQANLKEGLLVVRLSKRQAQGPTKIKVSGI